MQTFIRFVLLCLMAGNAFPQSSLTACHGSDATRWTNCFGTKTYANGSKYVGEYKDGKRNGQGTLTYANGNKYVGQFKDDEQNGQGTITIFDGDKYIGEFKDGKRYGQGTVIFANGDKYFDDFKDMRLNAISQLFGKKNVDDKDVKLQYEEAISRFVDEELEIESKKGFNNLLNPPSDKPFLFVTNHEKFENSSWWLKTIIARPRGNLVSGVTVNDINVYFSLNGIDSTWCYANALTRKSFTSTEKSIRSQIDETMWSEEFHGFQTNGVFTGRGKQNAIVGIFEDCNGRQDSFILITDRSQPKKIVLIKEMPGFTTFLKLKKSKVGDSLILSSCLRCGESFELSFDIKRKRFYWYTNDSN